MGAQSQINSLTNQVLATAATSKISGAANIALKAEAEEYAKKKSYGNELNKILGEEIDKDPKFKDADMFNRALDMMENKKTMMLAQREATRAYRNQYVKGSDEYNAIDSAGDARKNANFEEFRQSLRKMKKKKGGK